MGLNKQKGNMYGFIDFTWNIIKGKCYHECKYCYMKRFGEQPPIRFDKSELKTNLGDKKHIFVGSSCDMFADNIPDSWINKIFEHCNKYPRNKYFFQSKNPARFNFLDFPKRSSICTTIETNRYLPKIMHYAPDPNIRMWGMVGCKFNNEKLKRYVTIEPIMEFDLFDLVYMIKKINPIQVNIGADSGNNNLPEPSRKDVMQLIAELDMFTKVHLKDNLNRLIRKK